MTLLPTRQLIAAIAVAATGLPLLAAEADLPAASTLKIRNQVALFGDTVRLGDILDFSAADPGLETLLAEEPIATGATGATVAVSYEQIEERLSALRVNRARVLLTGARACQVELRAAPTNPTAAAAHAEAIASPLIREESGIASTLAAAIQRTVEADFADVGGRADLQFERGSDELLALTSPPYEFIINPVRGPKLGMREFRVTIRRDGRTFRSLTLIAQVHLLRSVYVARQPLNLGRSIGPDDIALEERLFTSDRELGCADAALLLGRPVKRFVPTGEMVSEDDLQAVELVRRSQPVLLEALSGGVRIEMNAVALDGGQYGETVRVRLGSRRQGYREARAVVVGMGRVQQTGQE